MLCLNIGVEYIWIDALCTFKVHHPGGLSDFAIQAFSKTVYKTGSTLLLLWLTSMKAPSLR
jgi:hypothetical protein